MKVSSNVKEDFPAYLNDEAKLLEGTASKIYFPESESEITEILVEAYSSSTPITVSGGGTGISGGRVPLGGWIIATDKMTSLIQTSHKTVFWTDPEFLERYELSVFEMGGETILRVPPAIRLKSIQNFCAENGLFYPPDPTERNAFIGGNVATNASGARSFKFGPTRHWVLALSIVLPDGRITRLERAVVRGSYPKGDLTLKLDENLLTDETSKEPSCKLPDMKIPDVRKNVAGIVLREPYNEPLDVFIGTNGIFGVVTDISLRVIKKPKNIIAFFAFFDTWEESLMFVTHCQSLRDDKSEFMPMSVEFLDKHAVEIMNKEDSSIPVDKEALIYLECFIGETQNQNAVLEFWANLFDSRGIDEILVGETNKEIERFKFLRHLIPSTINEIMHHNKQPKLGTDYSVPNKYFKELMALGVKFGEEFKVFQTTRGVKSTLSYAIWAHAGDSHLHLNFLPSSDEETTFCKKKMVEMMKFVTSVDGSIAAEHGLGKKKFSGIPAIEFQFGKKGLEELKQFKSCMDKKNILNRGNLTGF